MNDEDYRKIIAEELPNVPEDVRDEWFLPASRNNGWPPAGTYWEGVLLEKGIEFWKKTTWAKEDIDLENVPWHPKTNDMLRRMNQGFHSESDPFFGTKKEKSRIVSIMKHVFETGTIPKHISLLAIDGGYELADGHHRLFAIAKTREIINSLNQIKEQQDNSAIDQYNHLLRNKWGIESIAPLHEKHQVWVARHPDPRT